MARIKNRTFGAVRFARIGLKSILQGRLRNVGLTRHATASLGAADAHASMLHETTPAGLSESTYYGTTFDFENKTQHPCGQAGKRAAGSWKGSKVDKLGLGRGGLTPARKETKMVTYGGCHANDPDLKEYPH